MRWTSASATSLLSDTTTRAPTQRCGLRIFDGRRILYCLAAPLLVPLLYGRIARNVVRTRRNRAKLVLATPLILAYTVVTAVGESVGYAAGAGTSLLRVK